MAGAPNDQNNASSVGKTAGPTVVEKVQPASPPITWNSVEC